MNLLEELERRRVAFFAKKKRECEQAVQITDFKKRSAEFKRLSKSTFKYSL